MLHIGTWHGNVILLPKYATRFVWRNAPWNIYKAKKVVDVTIIVVHGPDDPVTRHFSWRLHSFTTRTNIRKLPLYTFTRSQCRPICLTLANCTFNNKIMEITLRLTMQGELRMPSRSGNVRRWTDSCLRLTFVRLRVGRQRRNWTYSASVRNTLIKSDGRGLWSFWIEFQFVYLNSPSDILCVRFQ